MDQIRQIPHFKRKNSLFGKIVELISLCILFVLYILPFYWMIIGSLKTSRENMASTPVWWPEKFMWSNYVDAWKLVNFQVYGKNSIILACAVVIASLAVSIPCAYAFARMEFRFKKPLFAVILSDMMIPAQCVVLPVFLMFSKIGWLNTYRSLIVLFAYSGFTIFFIRNAFMQVDNEVLEAARLDGASELSVMFRVAFPMVKPVMVTMILLRFLGIWNGYFWVLALTTNDNVRTLPIAVDMISLASNDMLLKPWGKMLAGATMLMAPMLIAYIFANKQIKNAFGYSGIK